MSRGTDPIKTPEAVDRLLREVGGEAFAADADERHVSDERLACHVLDGRALTPDEIAHLGGCGECRDVLATELETRRRETRARRWVQSTLLAGAAVACTVGFAVTLGPERFPQPGARTRGAPSAPLAPEVTVLAIDGAGRRRELTDGDRITQLDKLGFRYGNPGDAASTLTVVGWDGRRLHWYYPGSESEPATPIRGGGDAMSIRLPFDIALSDHPPGPLRVVIAFDRAPPVVARALRRGDPLEKLGAKSLSLVLTSSRAAP